MALHRDYPGQVCSAARALEVVGERWTLLVMRDVLLGVHRFDQLVESVGTTRAMLTRRLTPPVTGLLVDGVREGVFTTPDAEVTAEMLVLLALSTRARVIAPPQPPGATGEPGSAAARESGAPPASARWVDGYLTTVERVLGLPSPTFARDRATATERRMS